MMSNLEILTDERLQAQHLRSKIVTSLTATPKSLPSILLWDDAGHELFKQITKSRSYYGPQAERAIIKDRIDDICNFLGKDGVLIELGAGAIPHTSLILSELCRRKLNTQYLAHDLCEPRLDQGLCRLARELRSKYPLNLPRMRGIVGTYEEFFGWLSKATELDGRRVVVIWLGNCLSHYSDAEFPKIMDLLMHSLALSGAASSTLMLAVNGSKEKDTMLESYDSPDGTSEAFVANALRHANRVLGTDALDEDSWTPISNVHSRGTSIQWRFRAKHRTQILFDDQSLICKAGEEVGLIEINERDEADISRLLETLPVELVDIWKPQTLAWNWFIIANHAGMDGDMLQVTTP